MRENILINQILDEKESSIAKEILLVISGVIFLGLVSQVVMPLPFTPVPITGQTFGILLLGLVYGKKLGLKTIGAYLAAGSLGMPVFLGGTSGLLFLRPTGGYLIGFFFAVMLCGYLTEKGWAKSYGKTLLIMILAEIVLYTFGLVHLSLFVKGNVLLMGLYPFLAGEVIKIALITLILPSAWKIFGDIKK